MPVMRTLRSKIWLEEEIEIGAEEVYRAVWEYVQRQYFREKYSARIKSSSVVTVEPKAEGQVATLEKVVLVVESTVEKDPVMWEEGGVLR